MSKHKTSIHHIIPISMQWEDIKENTIEIATTLHKELHNTQNVVYWVCRKFKKKTNHILIPDDTYFKYKEDLLQKYFEKASIEDQ